MDIIFVFEFNDYYGLYDGGDDNYDSRTKGKVDGDNSLIIEFVTSTMEMVIKMGLAKVQLLPYLSET